MSSIAKIRIILWLGVFASIGYFSYQGLIPSGRITYSSDLGGSSYFIRRLTPVERVGADKLGRSSNVIGDPVYFSLYTPRPMETALLKLRYANTAEAPLIETGVLVDKKIWRYDLEPVENRMLDSLLLVWDKRTGDGGAFLLARPQAERKYSSLEDFLENPPDPDKVATYNFNWQPERLFDSYSPKKAQNRILKLRGNYEFFVYVKNEDLKVDFSFQDLNQNKDADPVNVRLLSSGELIDELSVPDDGEPGASGKLSAEKNVGFNLKNLPEGVYRIEVRANKDIITDKLETPLSKIAFLNRVELHYSDQKNFRLFTNSRQIQAVTEYPDRLQSIRTQKGDLKLEKTYLQYRLDLGSGATSSQLDLEKDGVILSGSGLFSFGQEAFFDPRIKRLDADLDVNAHKIDYVLARYNQPAMAGEWKEAWARIDLRGAYRENNRYSFLLSVPGLDEDPGIIIDAIEVELEGRRAIHLF